MTGSSDKFLQFDNILKVSGLRFETKYFCGECNRNKSEIKKYIEHKIWIIYQNSQFPICSLGGSESEHLCIIEQTNKTIPEF